MDTQLHSIESSLPSVSSWQSPDAGKLMSLLSLSCCLPAPSTAPLCAYCSTVCSKAVATCSSYFPVAMVKHHDRDYLEKKGFIGVYGSRGGYESMTGRTELQGVSDYKQEAERRDLLRAKSLPVTRSPVRLYLLNLPG